MLGLLRAILTTVIAILEGQEAAKADIDEQLAAQSAAIEHLRELIEGDSLPAIVGRPKFTPTGGSKK